MSKNCKVKKIDFYFKINKSSIIDSVVYFWFGLRFCFYYLRWGGDNPFHFNEILLVLVLPKRYIFRYHNIYLSLNFVIFASQGCMICLNYMVIFTLN